MKFNEYVRIMEDCIDYGLEMKYHTSLTEQEKHIARWLFKGMESVIDKACLIKESGDIE